jgi:RNA polymerase sigma-70 factor (ECF subfamily)
LADSYNYKTQRLISLAKGGDESALDRLCKVYGERVRRIVRLRMGRELRSKMESMDVVQDAFISALRSLDDFTYDNEGDFLRWLSKIAENRIRDNLEKLHADKRDIRKEIPLNSNRQAIEDSFVRTNGPVDSTTPSVIMSRREELDKLEKAMDKLRPEYREVIVWVKIEGLSHEDAAKRLNKSSHSTRALLSRALGALTEVYGEV